MRSKRKHIYGCYLYAKDDNFYDNFQTVHSICITLCLSSNSLMDVQSRISECCVLGDGKAVRVTEENT